LILAAILAATQPAAAAGEAAGKIHITADRLVAKSKDNLAEFIGNVEVTQGETAIRADRIRIYTKNASQGDSSGKPDKESIDRIVAEGNVRIHLKDGTAVGDQAEYQADKRVIILSGAQATVTRGGNSISGSRITLYRDDGRINVDGGERQRVEAVFVSEERLIE
jgi:lipopolysaccharide export system protein LptA